MAKPFSIQSPENIAKEYAGNKQRIAEAMQMGVVDATAGVLAGMFIDRMRSAQMQEQAPQQTVAQQVMGGAPPPPPPPPSGGLGATPQAALQAAPQGAPPMAPPMDMPPEMGMAPPGMAEGGIVGLDVPSYMFDEPDNGSYAGGGLVAFAQGGGADLAAFRRAIIQQESGGRYGIPNAEGSGAMGIGQIMPDTARALAKRLGLPYRPDLLAGKDKAAQDYQIALTNEATREAWDYGDGDIRSAAAYYHAGPNKKGWGPKTAKYQNDILRRLGMDSGEGAQLPERDVDTAEGRRATFQDQIGVMGGLYGQLPDSGLGALEEYYRGELAPEKQEKARKDDMWMALAQLGANMASSKSPNFLQAAGEAIAATMPGIAGSKKERKAAEREARTGLREVLGLKRAEQKEVIDAARDLYRIELGAEGSEAEREARAAAAADERAWRSTEAEKERKAAEALARIKQNPSDMESAIVILQSGTPEQKAALREWLQLKQQYSGASAQDDLSSGGGGQGSGNPAYKYQPQQ
jgi:hypothetical protein